jgi:beta-phosphoglucomutase
MAEPTAAAVIWDVDGTLVDTADLHYQAWARLAEELRKPFTRADFTSTFGWRNPEIIRRVWDADADDAAVAAVGRRKEEYYRAAARAGVTLLPGVRPLLEGLHAAGFRQAVGSSAPLENLDLILGVTGTRRFFEAVVSAEDTQRGKPDPQVFLIAADKVGVAPAHCLVMEDAVVGAQAAKAAGMKCIAVRLAGHHGEDALRAAGADLVVPSLEQVSIRTVEHILGRSA